MAPLGRQAQDTADRQRRWCPSWCVMTHGTHDGEDDWLHLSDAVFIGDEVSAVIAMTADPEGHWVDGPRALVGSEELDAAELVRIAAGLTVLAATLDQHPRVVADGPSHDRQLWSSADRPAQRSDR